MSNGKKSSRRRRSSSLLYQEPPESMEHMSDQSALPNLNANWVNAKGTLAGSLGGITAFFGVSSLSNGYHYHITWLLHFKSQFPRFLQLSCSRY